MNKDNLIEPYCHECGADLKQVGSVLIIGGDGNGLFCHLIPGEGDSYEVLVDSSDKKVEGFAFFGKISCGCTGCNKNFEIIIDTIELDPDYEPYEEDL